MREMYRRTSLLRKSTIDSQGSRMTGRSSFVGRRTRVLSRVSRGHGLDAEDAILSRGCHNVNIRTITADWFAVQSPRDLDW